VQAACCIWRSPVRARSRRCSRSAATAAPPSRSTWASHAPPPNHPRDGRTLGRRRKPARLRRDDIPLPAQIIGIAQVLEIFWQQRGVEASRDVIRRRRRRWFSPDLSRLALALLDDAAFWRALGDVASIDLLHDVAPAPAMLQASDAHLDRIVDAFAGVIDAVAPHARSLAARGRLRGGGGRAARLLAGTPGRLRRAALPRHRQIGRLERILDKPGRSRPTNGR
jgi:hypothetical protein